MVLSYSEVEVREKQTELSRIEYLRFLSNLILNFVGVTPVACNNQLCIHIDYLWLYFVLLYFISDATGVRDCRF